MNRFIEYVNEKLWNRIPGKKAPFLVDMLFDGEASPEHSKHVKTLFSPESLSHELDQRAKVRNAVKDYFGQVENTTGKNGTDSLRMVKSDKPEIESAWVALEKRIISDGGFSAKSRKEKLSFLRRFSVQPFGQLFGLRTAGGLAFAMSLAFVFIQSQSFYGTGAQEGISSSPGSSLDSFGGSEQIANRETAQEAPRLGGNQLDDSRLNDPALKLENFFASRRVLPDNGHDSGLVPKDGYHFVSNNGNLHGSDDADSRLYRLPTPNGLVEFSTSGNLGFHSNALRGDYGSDSNWDSQLISRERISEELRSQYPD